MASTPVQTQMKPELKSQSDWDITKRIDIEIDRLFPDYKQINDQLGDMSESHPMEEFYDMLWAKMRRLRWED